MKDDNKNPKAGTTVSDEAALRRFADIISRHAKVWRRGCILLVEAPSGRNEIDDPTPIKA